MAVVLGRKPGSSGGSPGSQTIRTETLELDTDELIAASTSPAEVVAAQGPGTVIVPDMAIFSLEATRPFSGGDGNVTLELDGTCLVASLNFEAGDDLISFASGNYSGTAGAVDSALSLTTGDPLVAT